MNAFALLAAIDVIATVVSKVEPTPSKTPVTFAGSPVATVTFCTSTDILKVPDKVTKSRRLTLPVTETVAVNGSS